MKLQYSPGPSSFGGMHWVDCKDRTDEFIDRAAAFNKVGRDEVLDRLNNGKRVRFDSEWYADLRDADCVKPPAPRPAPPAKCRCKVCGEWLPPSRFTTLPASSSTCDDCA